MPTVWNRKTNQSGSLAKALSATGLALSSCSVLALGLGPYDGVPVLGEQVNGTIDINGEIDDRSAIQVRTLSGAEASKYGFDVVSSSLDLNLNVDYDSGKPFISVRSSAPVKEPYIEFVVELLWPTGNIMRQYLVLPHEPTSTTAKAPKSDYLWQSQLSQDSAAPGPATQASSRSNDEQLPRSVRPQSSGGPAIDPGDLSYEVRSGDLLSLIARNWGRSTGQSSKQLTRKTTDWLIENNPHAFDGSPDNLIVGSKLTLPKSIESVATKQPKVAPTQSQPSEPVAVEVESISEPERSGRLSVVSARDSLSIDSIDDSQDLITQIAIANDEISRLTRENSDLRQRLDNLESGTIQSLLDQIDELQRQELSRLEQMAAEQSAAKETAAVGANINSDNVSVDDSALTVAQPSLVDESRSADTGSNWFWLLSGLLGLLIAPIGYILVSRRGKFSNEGTARFSAPEPVQFETGPVDELPEPASDDSPALIEPLVGEEIEIALPADDLADSTEDLEIDDQSTEPADAADTTPSDKPASQGEGEVIGRWQQRKFGQTETTQEDFDVFEQLDGDELTPLSEAARFDVMASDDAVEQIPTFELDEALFQGASDSGGMNVEAAAEGELEGDDLSNDLNSYQGPGAADAKERELLDLVDPLTALADAAQSLADKASNGLIQEVSLYIHLGRLEQAKKLLKSIDPADDNEHIQRLRLACEQAALKKSG